MNKLLFAFPIVALLAAGCGSPQQQSQKTSLSQILMSGVPQKCEASFAQNQNTTVYADGGKMMADSTAQVNGVTQTSHTLNDGQYTYIWVDGMTTGLKTQNQPAQTTIDGGKVPSSPEAADTNNDYLCSPWVLDSSKFNPPLSVNFSGTAMQTSNNSSATPTTQQTQAVPTNLATYISSDLGLSFKYPTDLKVYQQDANDILIQASYQNPQHPLAIIEMSIKKTTSSNLLTQAGIAAIDPSNQTVTDLGTQGNYQVLKVTNQYHSRYYFLGGKVTFIVDNSLDEDVALQTFTQQSDIYQTYTAEFDAIRSSIIFN